MDGLKIGGLVALVRTNNTIPVQMVGANTWIDRGLTIDFENGIWSYEMWSEQIGKSRVVNGNNCFGVIGVYDVNNVEQMDRMVDVIEKLYSISD